jgi:hypothetical protein
MYGVFLVANEHDGILALTILSDADVFFSYFSP